MNTLTELIKSEIDRQYGSLLKFCDTTGFTYSSLLAGLKRGIESMAYSTVEEICRILNIKPFRDVYLNADSYDILEKLKKLDEAGEHTIKTILNVEYERCRGSETVSKSFGGIIKQTPDDEHIKKLVREVLLEQKKTTDAGKII